MRLQNCPTKYSIKTGTNCSYQVSFKYYQSQCKFKFALNYYPNEFDFELVKIYGWYSAKNHGGNLSGVSRDHIISARYGFDNNIDSKIIAHPANCQLLIHNENSRKHTKCGMTIEQLLEKIQQWNIKYGN